MGTGTSKRGLALAALTLGLAGCGGGGSHAGARQGGAFGWLRPQPPPPGWRVVSIPSGATMSYPPNWQRQHADPGTSTAVLLARDGAYLGYVNLTPKQGAETLSNWASFRLAHNRDEGDRSLKRLAAQGGLRFRTGRGACVQDSYTTATRAHFVEIACLVAGAHAESVIVAAAPPSAWASESATLEREIEAMRA